MEQKLIDMKTVQEKLNIGRNAIKQLVEEELLPQPIIIGIGKNAKWRFHSEDIEQFLSDVRNKTGKFSEEN